MRGADAAETRARLLSIAEELFSAQTYVGTSIADLADQLGTTKAALYYHFSSKAEILDALVAEPLAVLAEFSHHAARQRSDPAEMLDGLIDLTISSRYLLSGFQSDPSAMAALRQHTRRHYDLNAVNQSIVDALVQIAPGRGSVVRAHAALAAVRGATAAALRPDGTLAPADRREITAAALRALGLDGSLPGRTQSGRTI